MERFIEIPKFDTLLALLYFPLSHRLSIETGVLLKKGEKTKQIYMGFINSPGGTIQPMNIAYNYHYH